MSDPCMDECIFLRLINNGYHPSPEQKKKKKISFIYVWLILAVQGFCFIEFETEESAQAALKTMNGFQVFVLLTVFHRVMNLNDNFRFFFRFFG